MVYEKKYWLFDVSFAFGLNYFTLRLPPPRRTPPLLPRGAARPTPCPLFLVRIARRRCLLITHTSFIGPKPSAVAQAFIVAGWQPRTLLRSSNIIVDSFREHLESGERARPPSLAHSLKCLAPDLVVVGCSHLCSHSRMAHPIYSRKKKVQIVIVQIFS